MRFREAKHPLNKLPIGGIISLQCHEPATGVAGGGLGVIFSHAENMFCFHTQKIKSPWIFCPLLFSTAKKPHCQAFTRNKNCKVQN